MLTFHNDKKIKDKYIARLTKHAKLDEIIQGSYWENGKGCAVGCTIHGSEHSKYETELGIPRVIARLEDRIFEGLANKDAKSFPLRFLQSVPVGVDLSLVFYKFMHWLLVDEQDGVLQYARPDGVKAIKKVALLMQKVINKKKVSEKQWDAAYAASYASYAAYAASAASAASASYAAYYAASAASAASYASAASADSASYAASAYYAAYYAASAASAASAAYYAASAAYYAASAASDHYKKMSDKLIEIISLTV